MPAEQAGISLPTHTSEGTLHASPLSLPSLVSKEDESPSLLRETESSSPKRKQPEVVDPPSPGLSPANEQSAKRRIIVLNPTASKVDVTNDAANKRRRIISLKPSTTKPRPVEAPVPPPQPQLQPKPVSPPQSSTPLSPDPVVSSSNAYLYEDDEEFEAELDALLAM